VNPDSSTDQADSRVSPHARGRSGPPPKPRRRLLGRAVARRDVPGIRSHSDDGLVRALGDVLEAPLGRYSMGGQRRGKLLIVTDPLSRLFLREGLPAARRDPSDGARPLVPPSRSSGAPSCATGRPRTLEPKRATQRRRPSSARSCSHAPSRAPARHRPPRATSTGLRTTLASADVEVVYAEVVDPVTFAPSGDGDSASASARRRDRRRRATVDNGPVLLKGDSDAAGYGVGNTETVIGSLRTRDAGNTRRMGFARATDERALAFHWRISTSRTARRTNTRWCSRNYRSRGPGPASA